MIRISFVLLTFLVSFVNFLQAQCLVHTSSDTLCENANSLLPVQLLGPSFATADSFLYELNGQGIDGSQPINWQDTGDHEIIVIALNSSGQPVCRDTATFFVVPLPQVNYSITSVDTQCIHGNELCVRNQSAIWKEDSGSTIHKVLWGDGGTPFSGVLKANQEACYSYSSLQSRQYTVTIEVIDQRGCKAEEQYFSPYLKGIDPGLFTVDSNWCGAMRYGGTDLSINFDSSDIDSFAWLLDSVVFEKQYLAFAYPLEISGVRTLSLNIWAKDGCFSSFSQNATVMNPTIHSNKNDTFFIKDGPVDFHTPEVPKASFFWTFGDPNSGPNNVASKPVASHTYSAPGKYTVILQGSLTGCTSLRDTLFLFVTGPLARITPPAYSVRADCDAADTVFLSQSSLYYFNDANPSDDNLPGGKRNDRVKGVWDFGDLAAPACTTDTKNGLNVNINCRYSRDSATKHLYPALGKYTVRYQATDTVSMHSSVDSVTLQFGSPKLDDIQIQPMCGYIRNTFYLRWNTQSGRPQTTFRIIVDSLADRNDNTPNVLDSWIDEHQTTYDQFGTVNPLIKFTGAAIHQAYLDAGPRQSFHTDGYITIGLHLFNGDTNSAYCDTIIWLHNALVIPRGNMGHSTTLTHYTGSDSLSWNLTDRRLQHTTQLSFYLLDDYYIGGSPFGWGRQDDVIRDHHVGANTYDYILRHEGYNLGFTNGMIQTDSILIRHTNGNQLIFQDWRDTLIELPPAIYVETGRFATQFVNVEGCFANYRTQYIVNGHLNALQPQYPYSDTLLFLGDTLKLEAYLRYFLEEPDPITGAQYDAHEYWKTPKKYPAGNFRPTPAGGYETVEWKANGITFADSVSALFIAPDTGWYTIEMISTDTTGRVQRASIEVPVFGINPFLNINPDTTGGVNFNPSLTGLLINEDCNYFIEFEQQSVVLDPCIGRYGVPCLPEVRSGVRLGNGPVSFFTEDAAIRLPFDLLKANRYGLVYEVSSRTLQYDTLIDLDISLNYTVTDSVLCNNENLVITNLSTGMAHDVQYLVYTANKLELFGESLVMTVDSLPIGTYTGFIDAYPGDFLPGGEYCPVRTALPTIKVSGANHIDITGNTSGPMSQINLYTADIGHAGTGTYQWSIDNGSLLSPSAKDTVSAIFNPGNGKLMVAYTESVCPAVRDTLFFISTGISVASSHQVHLYPNPTKGILHLDGMEGRAVIRIYSAQGAEVDRREVDLSGFEIAGLNPGVYFLRVEGKEGRYFRFILEE